MRHLHNNRIFKWSAESEVMFANNTQKAKLGHASSDRNDRIEKSDYTTKPFESQWKAITIIIITDCILKALTIISFKLFLVMKVHKREANIASASLQSVD